VPVALFRRPKRPRSTLRAATPRTSSTWSSSSARGPASRPTSSRGRRLRTRPWSWSPTPASGPADG